MWKICCSELRNLANWPVKFGKKLLRKTVVPSEQHIPTSKHGKNILVNVSMTNINYNLLNQPVISTSKANAVSYYA